MHCGPLSSKLVATVGGSIGIAVVGVSGGGVVFTFRIPKELHTSALLLCAAIVCLTNETSGRIRSTR